MTYYRLLFFCSVIVSMLFSPSFADFWSRRDSPFNQYFKGIAAKADGTIFLGSSVGIYRFSSFSGTWELFLDSLSITWPDYVLSVSVDHSGNLWVGTGAGLYTSTDNGAHWHKRTSGLSAPYAGRARDLIENSSHQYLMGSYAGVYRSNDSGANWTQVLGAINNHYPDISSLAIDQQGYLFAGSEGFGVLKSADNGTSWTIVRNGLTDTVVTAISAHPSGLLFAGTRYSGMFRSSDNGGTWQEINSGIEEENYGRKGVHDIVINQKGTIFISTEWRCYSSTDSGNTWIKTNPIAIYEFSSLAVDSNGFLYGTDFWYNLRSSESTVGIPKITSPNTDTAKQDFYFQYNLTASASDGPGPLTYSLLYKPAWLSISGSMVSGTPTSPGDTSFCIRSSDGRYTDTKIVNIVVRPRDSLVVVSPAGGEIWKGGSTRPVSWTPADHICITSRIAYFSADNGTSWSVLDSSAGNTGSLTWILPSGVSSNQCLLKVRIYDAVGNFRQGVSNSFIIDGHQPTASILAPNGGEVLKGGEAYTILWSASDNFGVVSRSIHYSINQGQTWSLLDSVAGSTGSKEWILPSLMASRGCKLRISVFDAAGNSTRDTSDGAFTIDGLPPTVAVSSPNGGEVWRTGATRNVTWLATDTTGIASRSIYLSTNNGVSWSRLDSSAGNAGTWAWPIPVNIVSSQCLIRIQAYDSLGNYGADQSNAVFGVADTIPPSVSVLSPNGGEIWTGGSTRAITWNATDNISVLSRAISYSHDGGNTWARIDSSLGNTGTWQWSVPTGIPTPLYLVRIRVYDAAGNSGVDQSDQKLRILDTIAPSVSVTAPNGGEVWNAGSTHNILWNATDDHDVLWRSIFMSLDNGATWSLLDSFVSNGGSWSWSIPAGLSSSQSRVRVRAYDPSGNGGMDQSNAVFQIKDVSAPAVNVTSPNGGETWPGGSTRNISWTATDNTGVVSHAIYFSTNGGVSFSRIDSTTGGTGTKSWTVPANIASNQCMIQVKAYDSEGNSGVDQSNGVFTVSDTIKPSVAVTSPNGGEAWNSGATRSIQWTATDNMGVTSRAVSLSTNAGATWSLLDSASGNTGSYSWVIPTSLVSTQCLIRIFVYDSPGNAKADSSNNTFVVKDTIIPQVEITSFNQSGKDYKAGTGDTLAWTASDNIGLHHYLIWLSLDNAATWIRRDSVGPSTQKTYYQVPDTNAARCFWKVQAVDIAGNASGATNDSAFAIHKNRSPQIVLLNSASDTNKTVTPGDSLTYRISVSDPDGDPVSIKWYVNNIMGTSGSSDTAFTWTPDQTRDTIVVRAFDGSDSSAKIFFLVGNTGPSIQNLMDKLPKAFALYQSYPNPFNPATSIRFDVPSAMPITTANYTEATRTKTRVTLGVYNTKGQLVCQLVNEDYAPGSYVISWNGRANRMVATPSGLYFYKIRAGSFSETRSMLLMK